MTFSDETRVVRAGLPAPTQNAPLRPGPVLTSTYHLAGDVSGDYVYARNGNPTWTAYEEAVGLLDRGSALVFASGMAAITAVLTGVLRPGQTLVLADDCYYATRQLAARLPLRVLTVPSAELASAAPEADLLWLETPSNPSLELCDVAALSALCPGLVAVDSTTATAFGQTPLDLGADLVVCADTKLTCGHSDLLLGHVSARSVSLLDGLGEWRRLTGGIAGPQEVWLAHRSLATLGLRAARAFSNALEVALLLESLGLPVRYPGLASHPQHALAAAQMRGFGPVLGVDLATAEAAERFLSRLELVDEATSFGGVGSSAERRARWGGDDIGPGYVRFSAGIEDPADLLADVEQALR